MRSIIIALVALTFCGLAQAETFKIDKDNSKIEWVGEKISGKHNGHIKIKEGVVEFDGDKIVGGNIVIDMKSISNEDLKSEKWNKKLVDHLHSNDFFHTSKYPTAEFTIRAVKMGDDGMAKLTGDLTIRGKTEKAVTVDAKINRKDNRATANIDSFKIDRTDFNVKYNSGKFFSLEKLGDKMIYDEFVLKMNLVATKQIKQAKN